MGDTKTAPTFTKNIVAHHANGRIVGNNLRGWHDHVPSKDVGVKIHSLIKVRDGYRYNISSMRQGQI